MSFFEHGSSVMPRCIQASEGAHTSTHLASPALIVRALAVTHLMPWHMGGSHTGQHDPLPGKGKGRQTPRLAPWLCALC